MNVLWITCDEMRWDALPCFGNRLTSMPAADRMAAEGAAFDHTFCQMPKCVPSRCSMLTGRYPHVDGFRTLRGRRNTPHFKDGMDNDMLALYEDTPNIIPVVREAGFTTCLLGKNHIVEWNLHEKWFDQTSGWNFDRVPRNGTRPDLMRASYCGNAPSDFPFHRHIDAVSADETISFLETAKGKPFFALVDMSLPHPVYQTYPHMPAASLDLGMIPALPVPPIDSAPSVERAIRTSKNLEGLTDDDRRVVRRAYYSMCEFADRQIFRILEALDRLDLAQDTLVIYTADHGDFAGDHNCFEKWDTSFLDGVIRVPLLMRCPGRIPAGLQSSALVELIDLFPTILEGAGIEVPSYAQGRSLWPVLQDNPVADRRTSVFCQGGVEESLILRAAEPGVPGTDPVKQQVLIDFPDTMARAKMVRTADHKYIHRTRGDCELYDLSRDPDEMVNLVADPAYAGLLAEMRQLLLERLIDADSTLPEVDQLFA